MAKRPLSNVDTALLRMEDPTNLMMITGILVFGAPMDFERLEATLEHRLLRFDSGRSGPCCPEAVTIGRTTPILIFVTTCSELPCRLQVTRQHSRTWPAYWPARNST